MSVLDSFYRIESFQRRKFGNSLINLLVHENVPLKQCTQWNGRNNDTGKPKQYLYVDWIE
jgi:hypothetical protein